MSHSQHEVVPVKTYALVFAALLALTITTVAVSKLELGEYNFIVAMTIAVIKGTLVVMAFHGRQAQRQFHDQAVRSGGILLDGDSFSLRPQRLFQPRLGSGSQVAIGNISRIAGSNLREKYESY